MPRAIATLFVLCAASAAHAGRNEAALQAPRPQVARFDILATCLDENVYQIRANPDAYPARPSATRSFYLRTLRCRRQSDGEPAWLLLDQTNERVWLIYTDGEACEVINGAENRDEL